MAVGRADDTEVTSPELKRMADELREVAGASEAQIEAALAPFRPAVRDTAFFVHPDNVNAVRLFQAMATQWNMVTLATLDRAVILQTGLRYEVLDRVARGLGIEEGPADFTRLQIMEAEAIMAWSEARK